MTTKTRRPSQAEIHERVDALVADGANRAEAFSRLVEETGMRAGAGTIAAHYYREARQRTRTPTPKEDTVTPATAEAPAEAGTEEPDEQTKLAEVPKGQLAFDGFPIGKHRVKFAGTQIEINDDQVSDYKLGEDIQFTFTGRVVKRNNRLLTDDGGTSSVDHDIIVHMQSVARA